MAKKSPVKLNNKRKWIISVSIILGIFLVGCILLSWYVADQLTKPLPHYMNYSPLHVSDTYENISFPASDGLILKGWFFPGKSDKAIIFVHGLLDFRSDEAYFAMPLAKELHDQGYSILMYDTRGRGESTIARVGGNEGNDIIGAVTFLSQKGITPQHVGIIADSSGAVSLLMIADKLPTVGAMVVDSAAADMGKMTGYVLKVEKGIPYFLDPLIFFFTKTIYGVDVAKIRPIEKVAQVPNRRFLYLHGKQDHTFPLWNAQELLAKSNPKSKLVVFEHGGHIETWKIDPILYRKEVFPFLAEELNK